MPRFYASCWLVLASALVGHPVGAETAEVRLTPKEAVQRALQHNLDLKSDRLDPSLSTAAERIASSAFDLQLYGEASVAGSPGNSLAQSGNGSTSSSTDVGGEVGLRKSFTTGASVEGGLATGAVFGGGRGGLNPAYESGINLAARQPLLQGISRRANQAPLTKARLSREAALAMLERRAELVAVDTLKAYWDLRAAVAKLEIQDVALREEEATLRETEALINAGKLALSERASAEFAVQRQLRVKVQAEQEVSNVRDRMARLIGLLSPQSLATPRIVPISQPHRTAPRWTLGELQQQALKQRGDFRALLLENDAKLLEEQVAQHKLLPKLDLVAGLQLNGLSGDPTASAADQEAYRHGYWSSFIVDRVGWSAGLSLEVPLGNVQAQAQREISVLQRRQSQLAIDLATQALSLELNVAWRAVQSAREQLRLAEISTRVAETKLNDETERYKAGKTTAHILSTVQAEVVTERLAREQALADFIKAVVDVQAAAGVLLARMGLRADGKVRQ